MYCLAKLIAAPLPAGQPVRQPPDPLGQALQRLDPLERLLDRRRRALERPARLEQHLARLADLVDAADELLGRVGRARQLAHRRLDQRDRRHERLDPDDAALHRLLGLVDTRGQLGLDPRQVLRGDREPVQVVAHLPDVAHHA